jgi:hypothetical protein
MNRKEVKKMEKKPLSDLGALRQYMEKGKWGRKVELSELKALDGDERKELGRLAKVALEKGWE